MAWGLMMRAGVELQTREKKYEGWIWMNLFYNARVAQRRHKKWFRVYGDFNQFNYESQLSIIIFRVNWINKKINKEVSEWIVETKSGIWTKAQERNRRSFRVSFEMQVSRWKF